MSLLKVSLLNKLLVVVTASVISMASFAEGKIAVVDPTGAILGTTVGKAKADKFSKSPDIVSTKAKLDGIVAEINGLEAAFKKEGQTWSVEKKEDNDKKYQSLTQDYQFNVKKLQSAMQEARQQIVQEMAPKYQVAVKQVVEAEKIGLLLNPEAVSIASDEYNITAKVTDVMNKLPDQPAAPLAAPAKK